MGIFNKKTVKEETVVVAKKTFNDKLTDIKSIFKKAYDDATKLHDEMFEEVSEKQIQISLLETSISDIEKTMEENRNFINAIKKFI